MKHVETQATWNQLQHRHEWQIFAKRTRQQLSSQKIYFDEQKTNKIRQLKVRLSIPLDEHEEASVSDDNEGDLTCLAFVRSCVCPCVHTEEEKRDTYGGQSGEEDDVAQARKSPEEQVGLRLLFVRARLLFV
jgi:hypothetical protein